MTLLNEHSRMQSSMTLIIREIQRIASIICMTCTLKGIVGIQGLGASDDFLVICCKRKSSRGQIYGRVIYQTLLGSNWRYVLVTLAVKILHVKLLYVCTPQKTQAHQKAQVQVSFAQTTSITPTHYSTLHLHSFSTLPITNQFTATSTSRCSMAQ